MYVVYKLINFTVYFQFMNFAKPELPDFSNHLGFLFKVYTYLSEKHFVTDRVSKQSSYNAKSVPHHHINTIEPVI